MNASAASGVEVRGRPPARVSLGGRIRAGVRATMLFLAACSAPAKLQGAGGTCLLVTDCASGLVCVPRSGDSGGSRHCSKDTSTLAGTEIGGATDAGPPAQDGDDGPSLNGDDATPLPSDGAGADALAE